MSDDRILGFYAGTSPDDRGRSLDDVLAMSDQQLEEVHDYIQWLFPLRERSGANPWAPVLNEPTIATFRDRPDLRQRLRGSLLRMLAFYGLSLSDRGVHPNETFASRSRVWLHAGNHNHLRLTRILRSLRTLGLESEAQALFLCLREIYAMNAANITPATFAYWTEAVKSTVSF